MHNNLPDPLGWHRDLKLAGHGSTPPLIDRVESANAPPLRPGGTRAFVHQNGRRQSALPFGWLERRSLNQESQDFGEISLGKKNKNKTLKLWVCLSPVSRASTFPGIPQQEAPAWPCLIRTSVGR